MANKKFSDFTSKTSPSDVSFVVGYDGSDNVRISIANMNSAYLSLAGGTMTGNTIHGDNVKSLYGTGSDLEIYHDGTDSSIVNATGHLNIINNSDDKSIYLQTDDGSGGTTTYLKVDGLQNYTEFPVAARFMDSVQLQFGDSGDGYIKHTGTDMTIENSYDDGDLNFKSDNGSGGVTEYFWLDGGIVKTRFAKEATFGDNVKLTFGNVVTPDLEIYHSGSHSYIKDSGTGNLIVNATNFVVNNSGDTQNMITATDGGAVTLFTAGVAKLATTSTGVSVTGQVNISALNTAVTNASDTGTLGEIRFTADYIFVCVATDTWKRVAIATW
jgi:hypothetical protein